MSKNQKTNNKKQIIIISILVVLVVVLASMLAQKTSQKSSEAESAPRENWSVFWNAPHFKACRFYSDSYKISVYGVEYMSGTPSVDIYKPTGKLGTYSSWGSTRTLYYGRAKTGSVIFVLRAGGTDRKEVKYKNLAPC